MRDHILDRLAYLANIVINTKGAKPRHEIASAAMHVAISHYDHVPPSEGSP